MPWFKVTLQKRTWLTSRPSNPFTRKLKSDNAAPESFTTLREWTFQAKSRADVERLYEEAKAQGIEQVRGFELANIERVPKPADER